MRFLDYMRNPLQRVVITNVVFYTGQARRMWMAMIVLGEARKDHHHHHQLWSMTVHYSIIISADIRDVHHYVLCVDVAFKWVNSVLCWTQGQGQTSVSTWRMLSISITIHLYGSCLAGTCVTWMLQGSRVRPIWSHVHPNFSRVRLTNPRAHWCVQPFEKRKKSIRDSETLWFNKRHPPLGLYRGLKPIRDSEGGPPLWLAVVQIFLYVCVRVENASRVLAAVRQRERGE